MKKLALTGNTCSCYGDITSAYKYEGGHCLILAISARQGQICKLEDIDDIAKHPFVISAYARHKVGTGNYIDTF